MTDGDTSSFDDGWHDIGSDEEDALNQFPPGEEGMLQSHAGQDATFHDVMAGHGYIGCAPEQPGFAFPLRLFEIYRQLHRVCPRFSLDALSRALTHLHQGPRKSSLQGQLTIAYDAYLAIIRGVQARTRRALGRTGSWYMDNVCPPCLYKMVNEPYLKFSWLGSMDGNNSLKLVWDAFRAGNTRADDRISTHDRWMTPEQVDIFKDEVADNATTPSNPSARDSEDPPPEVPDDDIAWLNVNEIDAMEVEELAKCINTCVDRWRNAGPEQRKKMFALFAVAGIFLTVCRHGHVVVMCDMIRSGELMKYPLAMVQRLLDRYGKDIGLGYDIMCAFFKTLLRSSLGPRVVAMNLRGVVPAFHGHAHNRACQVGWHPLYVEGVGLEDFEECERTFGKSNHLASVTRLTTPFHRQQAIDEHFDFHDIDKHAASGNFIYQNYRQALEKISMNRGQLDVLEQRLHTTGSDYEADLRHEQEYFKSLQSEPPEVSHTVDQESEAAKIEFRRLDDNIINNFYTRADIARVRTQYRTTYTKYLTTQEELCVFEELHNIPERWTVESKEYRDALVLMTERRYKVAVRDLERLVVQRLFEMTKLGMSGVGYKMREKLGKALKTRAEAIRKALERYNAAAAALNPPRPRLTWHAVVNSASLAEFDWLRETRQDIREQPWAQPARREAMVLYFGIKRAGEEKVRLNVEIRRLITSMLDDHVDYYHAIAANMIPNPSLAHMLQMEWMFRTRLNASIAARLAQTSRLTGFTGSLFPVWLEQVLNLRTVSVEYEEPDDVDTLTDEDRRQYLVNGLAREEDFDDDLVIQLMETLSTNEDV
ncbi:hypothetical protein B0H11DRAFT_2153790 [Mycena galericulata]|nr:hypothetical protein B0H11DRAFT_2153790 [Mycena galericulata]